MVVYIHIFRGLYYGSYKPPREMVWLLGIVVFLLMMATAFMGYVLPWGQMSFWGAQVITGFFSALPIVGEPLRVWLLGGYTPDNATLNRFFSLHYLLPFVTAGVVILKIWALHIPGSSNPTGVEVKGPQDTVPFHPYYTAKDGFGLGVFLLAYCLFLFFMPNALGHPDNYIPANPLSTPAHIVPEWYFLPFYAMLKSFTVDFILSAKLWGVLAMFSSILLLFFLPWLDSSPVRSGNYRPKFKIWFWVLVVDIFVLGYVGGRSRSRATSCWGRWRPSIISPISSSSCPSSPCWSGRCRCRAPSRKRCSPGGARMRRLRGWAATARSSRPNKEHACLLV